MIKKTDVLAILHKFKQDYAEKYGIIEIGVFGSVARDQAEENSDIDIFIKTKTPNPLLLAHIKEDLENLVHTRIDIVRLREKMNHFLKQRIEKEGICV